MAAKDIEQLIPEHIRTASPYIPGKPIRQAETESGTRCIKMASNENAYGPSPLALKAIAEMAPLVNFYPDNDNAELRKALATHHQLSPEQIIVTDGSTALLDIIARSFLLPGLNAISSERSFIIYPLVTRVAGGRYVTVPMKNDTFDLEAIAQTIDADTRVIFLANPNNPTGTMFNAAETDAFLARVPDHVMVVLDEAYRDFAEYHARKGGFVYSHSCDYVRAGRKNIIVLRTFSKAHGLAGMRVGYGLGHPDVLRHFLRVRTAFSVSALAEAAAVAAMSDLNHIRNSVEQIARGAEYLTKELMSLGFRVVPTSTNFIYLEAGPDAPNIVRRLQNEGVIIRGLTPWGSPEGLRVTIGTTDQNRKFLAALKASIQTPTLR
jgi:histidinol-phosphate aminotransferase